MLPLALGAVAAGTAGAGAGIAGAGAASGAAGAAGGLSGLTSVLGKSGGGGGGLKMPSSAIEGGPVQIGLGLLQSIQANKLKGQAESYLPAYADPNQTAYLTELQQKRRSIDTGADFAAGMQAIDTTNAGTNEALVRSTGGDVGGTVQALLQSQGVANQGKNQVLAQGQQQQMQYNQMYGNLLSRIEDRKLQLQMYRSQQARAEWAKKQQQANQNMMAGLGRAVSGNEPSANSERTPALGQERISPVSDIYSQGKFVDTSILDRDINNINAGAIDDASASIGQMA